MLRPRIATARLHRLLRQFPAVSIVGPRQIGKSTLARAALPDFEHIDLERPRDWERVSRDPELALSQSRRVVIDEAQRLPQIFPLLRTLIDDRPRDKFVLLGSASPALLSSVSESLAGRVGFLELGAVSVFEEGAERIWIRGGFPRVLWGSPRPDPGEWYPAYLAACLERDVPQLGFRIAASRLRALLTMVAHAQGSLTNLSEIGASLGIDYHAVAHALDVLEGVFLVRRLPPYFANIRKRLVKSPKLYVRDTGMLHSLLGVDHARRALLVHPKAGASFETLCVEQIIEHARLASPGAQAFFYRTHGGAEVDLLLELRGALVPIEIKLGKGIPDLRGLRACMQDLGLSRGYVVGLVDDDVEIARGVRMLGLRALIEALGIGPGAIGRSAR